MADNIIKDDPNAVSGEKLPEGNIMASVTVNNEIAKDEKAAAETSRPLSTGTVLSQSFQPDEQLHKHDDKEVRDSVASSKTQHVLTTGAGNTCLKAHGTIEAAENENIVEGDENDNVNKNIQELGNKDTAKQGDFKSHNVDNDRLDEDGFNAEAAAQLTESPDVSNASLEASETAGSNSCFAKPDVRSVISILKDERLDPTGQSKLKELYLRYRCIVKQGNLLLEDMRRLLTHDLQPQQDRARSQNYKNFVASHLLMSGMHNRICILEVSASYQVMVQGTADGASEEANREAAAASASKQEIMAQAAAELYVASGLASMHCDMASTGLTTMSTMLTVAEEDAKMHQDRAAQGVFLALTTLTAFAELRVVVRNVVRRQGLLAFLVLEPLKYFEKYSRDTELMLPYEDHLLEGCLTLVYQMTSDEDDLCAVKNMNIVDDLKRYWESEKAEVRQIALLLLSAVLTEEEAATLQLPENVVVFLVKCLSDSPFSGVFSLLSAERQLVKAIQKFSMNARNKELFQMYANTHLSKEIRFKFQSLFS